LTGDLRLVLDERADRDRENLAASESSDPANVISAPDFTRAAEFLTGGLR